MRIACDLQAVTGPGRTGLGVSVQFMVDALVKHAPGVTITGLRPNNTNSPLKGVPDRVMWEQFRLPALLRKEHKNLNLDLTYSPALGAPISSPVPVMAHVHDLIPLFYRRQFSGVAGWYWTRLLPYTWKLCSALTVSNSTVRDDIVETLKYPAERIHVVPYYPDPAVAGEALRQDEDYLERLHKPGPDPPLFITIASHEPRKNLDLAILALGRLKRDGIKARLTLIGGHTEHTRELRDLASREGVTGQVDFPGYLDRVKTVYSLLHCTALLFVSTYEGYGMPPQEAQSVGCPVILSDIPCHRHIYADEQRFRELPEVLRITPPFVNPESADELAQAMKGMINETHARTMLRKAGVEYSRTFNAQATADALVKAFETVAG